MYINIKEIGPNAVEALHILWERVSTGDLDYTREIDIELEDGVIDFKYQPEGLVTAALSVTTPLGESSCGEFGLAVGSTYGDFAKLIGRKLGLI